MIDPGDVRTDMYPGSAPGELDERLVLEGWTYYVRATKDPDGLVRDRGSGWDLVPDLFDPEGLVFLVVLGLVLVLVLGAWRYVRGRRPPREDTRPWTVAVVRMGWVGSWNDLTPEVVHREVVSRHASPKSRIVELAADVRAGRFRPAA